MDKFDALSDKLKQWWVLASVKQALKKISFFSVQKFVARF